VILPPRRRAAQSDADAAVKIFVRRDAEMFISPRRRRRDAAPAALLMTRRCRIFCARLIYVPRYLADAFLRCAAGVR